jgi:hypothetical protein
MQKLHNLKFFIIIFELKVIVTLSLQNICDFAHKKILSAHLINIVNV